MCRKKNDFIKDADSDNDFVNNSKEKANIILIARE